MPDREALVNLSQFIEHMPEKTESLVLDNMDLSDEAWRETKRWLDQATSPQGASCE